jgi:hypothetical protein
MNRFQNRLKLFVIELEKKLGHFDLSEFTSPEQGVIISSLLIKRSIPKAKLKLWKYKDGPIIYPIIQLDAPGFNPIHFARKSNEDGDYWMLESFFAQRIETEVGFSHWFNALTLHTTNEETKVLDSIYFAGRHVHQLEDSLPPLNF